MSAHVSCCQKPEGKDLPTLYKNNLDSLMAFINKAHQGMTLFLDIGFLEIRIRKNHGQNLRKESSKYKIVNQSHHGCNCVAAWNYFFIFGCFATNRACKQLSHNAILNCHSYK